MPTPQQPITHVRLPDETPQGARIKVVGVGGGGSNAIDRMIDFGVEGVEFIALNTDVQALEVSKAPVRGQLGSLLTNGLSAGSDPNVGRRAAIQDASEIAEVLEGADMVFITAGLGGGTGTGAAPVIAAIASEMGALTVAIVTRPFNFEGKRRMAIADWGIEHLLRYVDTLIVIPNEKLLAIAKDAPFFESFKIADDFLRQAVQSITDIITTEGVINRDFADVKTTMAGMGYAVMGTASRSGPTRAIDAVMDAMASPLLEEGAIDGARGILINITGSSSLRLSEVNAASRVIQSVAHEDANIIFGAVLDERLGDEVKATVIATGFRNDGRDRSERRAKLLRATAPEAVEPEPAAPEYIAQEAPAPEVAQPVNPEPEAVVETPTIEDLGDVTPVVERALPEEPEAIDATPVAIPAELVEPETESVEVLAFEEQQLETPEASLEEPEAEAYEAEQSVSVQEQIEEMVEREDQHLAIEVYESQEISAEDPPRLYPSEVEALGPPELDAIEPSHSGLEDEDDWREAIREIASLAEPDFETEDETPVAAHWSRRAESPRDSETSRLESSPQNDFATDSGKHDAPTRLSANTSAPPKDRAPVAATEVPASAQISNTRRAAIAAYSAVSHPEMETETAELETKPANAFAQVLEARRRFVENLGMSLPAEESGTPTAATPLADEPEPAPQRQTRLSRPLTIDAEPTQASTLSEKDAGPRQQLHRQSEMPLFRDTAASEPSETNHSGLQSEAAETRSGELFERNWNSKIRVPSFGSIPDRDTYTDNFEDLDTPAFTRRDK